MPRPRRRGATAQVSNERLRTVVGWLRPHSLSERQRPGQRPWHPALQVGIRRAAALLLPRYV